MHAEVSLIIKIEVFGIHRLAVDKHGTELVDQNTAKHVPNFIHGLIHLLLFSIKPPFKNLHRPPHQQFLNLHKILALLRAEATFLDDNVPFGAD